MLASRMLTAKSIEHGHTGPLARVGGSLASLYARCLRACLDAPLLVVLVSVLFAAAAWLAFGQVRQELTPKEDRSSVFMRIQAPQGVSLDYTTQQLRLIESLIEPLRQSGEVVSTFASAGQGGSTNSGFMVLSLAPWEDRERSQEAITQDVMRLVTEVPGVRTTAFQPNSLGIRGAGSGLQFALVGNSYAELGAAAQKILAEMEKDPRFLQPRLSNESTQPQLFVDIDRERASDLGINIGGLDQALQSMLDGRKIGDVFIEDRSFAVKLVSTSNPINDPTDLENVFLKTSDGRFVPVSTIATLVERAVPPSLAREEQQRSVSLTAGLATGFPLGEAYDEAQAIAAPVLPAGSRMVPLAEAATLGETSGGMLVVFGFALVIVLLVLAAQFESFVSAVIIMATVPLGLACAVFALPSPARRSMPTARSAWCFWSASWPRTASSSSNSRTSCATAAPRCARRSSRPRTSGCARC
jgi:HAE1 family hydrophobic/amphiphilic exporter-1